MSPLLQLPSHTIRMLPAHQGPTFPLSSPPFTFLCAHAVLLLQCLTSTFLALSLSPLLSPSFPPSFPCTSKYLPPTHSLLFESPVLRVSVSSWFMHMSLFQQPRRPRQHKCSGNNIAFLYRSILLGTYLYLVFCKHLEDNLAFRELTV